MTKRLFYEQWKLKEEENSSSESNSITSKNNFNKKGIEVLPL